MLVERLIEPNQKLYPAALESLRTMIKASTTSMTSVPKPLKFLRVHYDTLKGIYEKIKDPNTKVICDVCTYVTCFHFSNSFPGSEITYAICFSKVTGLLMSGILNTHI